MKSFLPDTEKRNAKSKAIDALPIMDVMKVINDEDKTVAFAVEKELGQITEAAEAGETALRGGGRILYMGCGTSGRLGVLDASECPPTYGVSPDLVIGIIAGGDTALRKSIEGAEDSTAASAEDLKKAGVNEKDFVIGISASGKAPYVLSGLRYARQIGAKTALISCSKKLLDPGAADIVIAVDTGPEVVTGSTRMKAGTAQKMILNMISTGVMIRLGKVFGNLMVDVWPSNEKLMDRAKRIIVDTTGCPYEEAEKTLKKAGFSVKTAIVMIKLAVSREEAEQLLAEHGGLIKNTLKSGNKKQRIGQTEPYL